jgi:hypothetical protein
MRYDIKALKIQNQARHVLPPILTNRYPFV